MAAGIVSTRWQRPATTGAVPFGLPDWLGDFQNPEFPAFFAEYALAFARRYPWVWLYTPVHAVEANLRAAEAIGGVCDAWVVQSETIRYYHPHDPDAAVRSAYLSTTWSAASAAPASSTGASSATGAGCWPAAARNAARPGV